MEPKDFQNNSAERIVELFQSGQNRVLLADEVGLGKTIVARAVVKKMHGQAKAKGKPFKVIYVCSNQGIIQQNAHKLGIDEVVPLSESRLSMQHKTLYQNQDKDYLIPITPATSLEQTNGSGNANERALIFLLIHKSFNRSERDILKWYLDVHYSKKKKYNSENIKHTYWFEHIKDIKDRFPTGYYKDIRKKLENKKDFSNLIEKIKQTLKAEEPNRKYINDLRTLFCEISMDMLNPNLVIMDEFQRYRDLMEGGIDTEENRLAQWLFSNENTKILLVSATPYKPMVTMEEISQTGRNEQFEDFHHLMRFLMGNDYNGFEKNWNKYSNLLGSLSENTIDDLVAAKEVVEQDLQKVMVRTERYVPNLTSNEMKEVTPTAEEVKEYKLLRELLSDAAKASGKKNPPLNIDYVKSAPFLLSFMQQYVEKDFIEKAYENEQGPKKRDGLLVVQKRIENKDPLICHNARLKVLCDMLFQSGKDRKDAANLLWVPASMPYYKPVGIFERCSDFSKILVFSRWGFVPRMLATVLSYTAAIKFDKEKGFKEKDSYALNKCKELLLSPFPNLSKLYEKGPQCEDLKDVRERIKNSLKERLGENINNASKRNVYKDILKILNQINDGQLTSDVIVYESTLDFIVNIIIASPGVCLWRCFKKEYGDTFEEVKKSGLWNFANAFVNMLGNDESQGIIKNNIHRGRVFERVVEYCMNGNLQAVIDEYAFVLGYNSDKEMGNNEKKALWEKMGSSIIIRSSLNIDTDESFLVANGKMPSIKRWFACDYAKLKADDKDEKHKISVQSAFNSPFRPFVLASTSVGQEGLDFHLYCRKIVHWNLPSNPVDLEQRSGRIDRYACLAIRRNVARLSESKLKWQDAFENVYEKWHKLPNQYNDLVPYWCLPRDVIEKQHDIEKIENIFLLYPMSVDTQLYAKLKKQLSLYRLTMGQPDQEFVIELLEKLNLDEDEKEKLMFHLSPEKNHN